MPSQEVSDFQALLATALGRLAGETLRGGNADFIRLHTAWLPEMEAQAARLAEAGKTPLFFSQGDRLAGIIAVADVIKEDSPQAIRELKPWAFKW